MSTLKTIKTQLGISTTATQNFTITAEAANGTMKLARGNAGETTQDILTVDAAGKVNIPQSGMQLAKAWCNFNGTLSGTITPRSAFNITSIVKSATGTYLLTFTTPMADGDYAAIVTSAAVGNGSLVGGTGAVKSTTQLTVFSTNPGVALVDSASISVLIFGN